jgi:hypothetical protein
MAPRKMDKEDGESVNLNTYVLSNTSLRAINTVKYWTQVFDIIQHELINCLEDSGDKVTETHATKLRDITESDIHMMVVQPCWAPTTPPIFLQNLRGPYYNLDNYNELQNQPFQIVPFLGLL